MTNPIDIGIFIGINELNLPAHGIISPVSGWKAVPQTVSATLMSLISYSESKTSFLPVFLNSSASFFLWLSKSSFITRTLEFG